MNFWLIKSEPSTWSWDDQVREGSTWWDGVRNHQAAANLRAMQVDDRCFFYHSVRDREIVGLVAVCRTAVPDPSDPRGRFVQVGVRTLAPFPRPVTLAQIRAEPRLAHLALLRQSRLSVSAVDRPAALCLCEMGGLDTAYAGEAEKGPARTP